MFESQAGVGVSDGAVTPIRSLPLLLSLPAVKIMLPREYNHPPVRCGDSEAQRGCAFLKATQPVGDKARLSDPFQLFGSSGFECLYFMSFPSVSLSPSGFTEPFY